MNTKQIESKTLDILVDVYGGLDNILPPIDLNRIIRKYNIQLKTGKFSNPDISGVYDRKACSIYVAQDDQPERQRFTIAHELAHYFLDDNVKEDIFLRSEALNLDKEGKKQDMEANAFAASLLMPEFLVKRIWMQFKNTETIAQVFGVSNSACYYRLKNLGLMDEKQQK